MCRRWGTFLVCGVAALVLAGCKAPAPPTLSLSAPSELLEGQSGEAWVTISRAIGVDTVVEVYYTLNSGDGGRITMPGGVIISAGSGSATFSIDAIDDNVVNSGPSNYTVEIRTPGATVPADTATVDIYDGG